MAGYKKKEYNIERKDLPNSLESERVVLGAAISDTASKFSVMSSLQLEDFFYAKHQDIYLAIQSLMDQKKDVDVYTLTEELMNEMKLDEVGGLDYLQQLVETVISYANLQFYIDNIIDQSVLRKMLMTIRTIDEKYKTEPIDNLNDFILNSEQAFKDSVERRHISGFVSLNETTKLIETEYNNQKQQDYKSGDVTGLTTGYPGINHYTQGFHKGDMIVVAARPSVGKTALSLNFAYQVATKENVPVAVFSLEMSAESLVKRILASVSCVSLKTIQSGHFTGADRPKVSAALKEVSQAKIFIDEQAGIKMIDIVAKTRKLQAANPDLGLVIIDYLGLVQLGGNNGKGEASRNEEVRKISLAIKDMARELKIPVLVVSQLSRDVEKRDNKKPMLSDLRDSGAIEQDADVVMLLYRDDYYGSQKETSGMNKKPGKLSRADSFMIAKEQQEKELGEAMPGSASYVEVNIAKNRNGETGVCPLFFYKDFGRFDTPSKGWLEQMRKIQSDNNNKDQGGN